MQYKDFVKFQFNLNLTLYYNLLINTLDKIYQLFYI